MKDMTCRLIALFFLATALPLHAAAASDAEVWQALAGGGHVAMIRHARAPGTGDPANFRIGDCSTQRNLDSSGRDQARAIGDAFRANGIAAAKVYTSQWCRCRETAELLGLGAPEDLTPLNSFFGERAKGPGQTEALRDWLGGQAQAGPLVLVTHQVNITSFTGVYPSSGEMVVFRLTPDSKPAVVGTVLVR
ncbi:MAG: histidine phosphatase family protein [Rhodospirillales bacterium]